jgi:hypothetical protein
LAVPGVTAAIFGARQPAQVDSLVAAAGLELDYEDLVAIASAIETTGAGHGPIFRPVPPQAGTAGNRYDGGGGVPAARR